MIYIPLVIFAVFFAFVGRMLYLTNATGNQRHDIIMAISSYHRKMIRERDDWYFLNSHVLWDDFGSVSFDEHTWNIFLFRDKYSIYPESIQELMKYGTISG